MPFSLPSDLHAQIEQVAQEWKPIGHPDQLIQNAVHFYLKKLRRSDGIRVGLNGHGEPGINPQQAIVALLSQHQPVSMHDILDQQEQALASLVLLRDQMLDQADVPPEIFPLSLYIRVAESLITRGQTLLATERRS